MITKFSKRVCALKDPQHEIFCQHVAEGMPISQAYVEAGHSPRGARGKASRLIAKDSIATRISVLIQASVQRRERAANSPSLRVAAQQVDLLQDIADSLRRVIEHRAKGEKKMAVDWDGDPTKLSDEQLERMLVYFRERDKSETPPLAPQVSQTATQQKAPAVPPLP